MGGNKCVYFNCGLSKRSDPTIKLYRFPVSNAVRCHKWIIHSGNVVLADLSPESLRNRVICSKHFNEMFIQSKKLPSTAVPFRYINDESSEKTMVSTMEQCESKSIGPLASTLAIFDTFKNQEEDKDSDEESFHLPLLDDDTENVKEILSGTNTPCGETEDDILNKFETEAPPDLDATIEENILDEDENVKKNTTENDTIETVNNMEQNHNSDEIFQGLKVVDEIDEESENDNQIQTDNDQISSDKTLVNIDTEKNAEPENDQELQNIDNVDQENNEDASKEDEDTPDELKESENNEEFQESIELETEKENIVASLTEECQEATATVEVNDEHVETKDISDKLTEYNEKATAVMDIDNINDEDEEKLPEDEEILPEDEEKLPEDEEKLPEDEEILPEDEEKLPEDEEKLPEDEEKLPEDEKKLPENKDEEKLPEDENEATMNIDDLNQEVKPQEKHKKETTTGMDIDGSNCENKSEEKMSEDKEETTMDIDDLNNEDEHKDEEKISEDKDTTLLNIYDLNDEDKPEEKLSENIEEATTVMDIDDSKHKSTTTLDIDDMKSFEKDFNNEATTALDINDINKYEEVIDEATTALDIDDTSKHDEVIDEATTVDTADTNKTEDVNNEDLNCDDLLDISAIRDADEDDAIAAEVTESDTHLSEKFDIDERENKRQDEIDEMEMDQDYQASTERDEPMESDDNTNSCDRDTSTTDILNSDGESKDIESVENKSDTNKLNIDDTTQVDSNESTAESVEVPEKLKDASVTPVVDLKTSNREEDLKASKPKEDVPSGPKEDVPSEPKDVPSKPKEEVTEKLKENAHKRPLNEEDEKSTVSKKMRIDDKPNKVNTLINFEQFMKKRNLGDGKLTRSDLEQFCLQKICEAIIHKTDVGELHQTIKKQENIIDTLRKDILQLTKQARDLDIVNKKLMNEIKTHNGSHKPLVPLKITRSVGLQVKLNIGVEPVNRRKPYTTNSPRTPATPNNNNNNNSNVTNRRSVPQGNAVVRQILPTTPPVNSPRKNLAPAPILTQALQNRPTPTATQSPASTPPAQAAAIAAATKRATPIRPKATESSKPSAPGVIDLTDEDDKVAKTINNVVQKSLVNNVVQKKPTPVKMLNKSGNVVQKGPGGGIKTNNSPKPGGVKAAGTKVGMQPRAMTGLPQGVRLTTSQMKNGITLPAGVVTTNAQGGTQLMYVVQPGSLVNSTAGGAQKAVLLNFQPTNGVLTSTINGSTVSVIPSKPGNSMQVKQILPVTRKHPAPLPHPPPPILNNSLKKLLPKPHLSIRKTDTGIILQWRMPYNLDEYEGIASYQLFAYQETSAAPSSDMWRKVGDVKALALPMACTLTQFADKNKYYFAVRSIDVHKRIGAFSDPEEISL